VAAQLRVLQRCQQAGIHCACIEYLLETLQRTAPHRTPARPRRLARRGAPRRSANR
jgi:hypothetical protein